MIRNNFTGFNLVFCFLLLLLASCGGGVTSNNILSPHSSDNDNFQKGLPINYSISVVPLNLNYSAPRIEIRRISNTIPGENLIARFRVDFPEGVTFPILVDLLFKGNAPKINSDETVVLKQLLGVSTKPVGFAQQVSSGFRALIPRDGEYILARIARQAVPIDSFMIFASADRTSGSAPLTVNFSARPLNETGSVSYNWQFGDGGTSNEQNPTYTYTTPGNYVVLLSAEDSAENQFFSFSTPIEVIGVGVASISGIVRNASTGLPLSGILVTLVRADLSFSSTTTDSSGFYEFTNLPAGEYSLIFSGSGFTSYTQVVSVSELPIRVDSNLRAADVIPTSTPTFLFNMPPYTLDAVSGIATIDASIQEYVGDSVLRILNGRASTIPFVLEQDTGIIGRFVDTIILTLGTNSIRYVCANHTGVTVSDEIIIEWTPQAGERILFRATLTWDRGTETNAHDMDLHVVDPNGEEAYYANLNIGTGNLDVDNVIGFGPENFTAIVPARQNPVPGTYHVFVVYFSGIEPTNNTITLRVNPGTPNEEVVTVGPHLLQQVDEIWYAVDVIVDSSGLATYVIPGTPPGATFPN